MYSGKIAVPPGGGGIVYILKTPINPSDGKTFTSY
jgi:hypothetical protein